MSSLPFFPQLLRNSTCASWRAFFSLSLLMFVNLDVEESERDSVVRDFGLGSPLSAAELGDRIKGKVEGCRRMESTLVTGA